MTVTAVQAAAAAAASEPKPAPPAALHDKLASRLAELRRKRTRDASKPDKRKRQKTNAKPGKQTPSPAPSKAEQPEATPDEAGADQKNSNADDIAFGNLQVESGLTASAPKKKGSKRARLERALKKADSMGAKLRAMAPADQVKLQQDASTKLALLKAQGVKVKTDAKLLKQSIKKYDDKKKRSAKKWAGRIHADAKKKAERADEIRADIGG